MRSTTILSIVLVLGAIAGCKDDPRSGAKKTARSAETTPAQRGTIGAVDIGKSVDVYGGILDKSTSFTTNDIVYSSVDLKRAGGFLRRRHLEGQRGRRHPEGRLQCRHRRCPAHQILAPQV